MARSSKRENGLKSIRAGSLAEQAVERVFGVTEPVVEVKASLRTWYRFDLRLSQLERQASKDYVFVVYDRVRARISKGPRKGLNKHTLSVEDAFQQPLEFLVATGERLLQLSIAHQLPLRVIRGSPDYPMKLLVRFPLGLLKVGKPKRLKDGHVLYGDKPGSPHDGVPF